MPARYLIMFNHLHLAQHLHGVQFAIVDLLDELDGAKGALANYLQGAKVAGAYADAAGTQKVTLFLAELLFVPPLLLQGEVCNTFLKLFPSTTERLGGR